MDLLTLRFTYVSPAVMRIYGSTVEETLSRGVAEDILHQLQTGTFSGVGRVTASFGIAEHRAGEGMDELITRVDNLMYRAKIDGRSRLACDIESSTAT